MKSKARLDLNRFNKSLARNSWNLYREILLQLCKEHEYIPFVARLRELILADNWDEVYVFAGSLEAQVYSLPRLHFLANQFVALIKKYAFTRHQIPSLDPEREARRRFREAEEICRQTNERFRWRDGPQDHYQPELEYQMQNMRSFIAYVLGHEYDLSDIWRECDFGPGASLGVHGNATNIARKFLSDHWTVSPSALLYGEAAFASSFHIFELVCSEPGRRQFCVDRVRFSDEFRKRVRFVEHNKITFVPKTAKTHRSIAVEPLVNGYVQKGIDQVMRKRLRRIGIDLSDQSGNSEYARLGSLDDSDQSFVTIDLSMASDSLATEVVRQLIPAAWFELLNALRSKSYLLDNVLHKFEKFCSMGNGFCFPLQTLIFTAACKAVGAGVPGLDFKVYGDDIIVRRCYAEPVIRLLGELGFKTNTDKTFISGPFRESCGRDWFSGEDVRPFILDFRLDSLEALIKFHNLSRRNEFTTRFFAAVRASLLARLPASLCFFRPYEGPENTAFTVDQDVFLGSMHAKWNTSLQCWSWKELLFESVPDSDLESKNGYPSVLMIAAVRGAASAKPFTIRRETRMKIRRNAYAGTRANVSWHYGQWTGRSIFTI